MTQIWQDEIAVGNVISVPRLGQLSAKLPKNPEKRAVKFRNYGIIIGGLFFINKMVRKPNHLKHIIHFPLPSFCVLFVYSC